MLASALKKRCWWCCSCCKQNYPSSDHFSVDQWRSPDLTTNCVHLDVLFHESNHKRLYSANHSNFTLGKHIKWNVKILVISFYFMDKKKMMWVSPLYSNVYIYFNKRELVPVNGPAVTLYSQMHNRYCRRKKTLWWIRLKLLALNV